MGAGVNSVGRRRRVAAALVAAGLLPCARAAMAADASWTTGVSGNWSDATKWTNSANGGNLYYPTNGNPAGVTYDVTIGAAPVSGSYTVSLDTNIAVNSLTLSNASAVFNQSGAAFSGNVTLDAGTYQFYGGELSNSTVTIAGGLFDVGAGTLDNVTIAGADVTAEDGSQLAIADALSLGGHTLTLPDATTTFENGSSIANGTLAFTLGTINEPALIALDNSAGNSTTTIQSSATLSGMGVIYDNVTGGSTATLINQGTINANINGGTLKIQNDTFTNSATAEASNGGMLEIAAGSWSNSGTITALSGGIVQLDGALTLGQLGTASANGGTLNIAGTLDLQGQTLTLNNSTGTWNTTNTGTIQNGTLVFQDGQQISFSEGGELKNVTIDGNMSLANQDAGAFAGNVDMAGNTLTINGPANLTLVNATLSNAAVAMSLTNGTQRPSLYTSGSSTLSNTTTVTGSGNIQGAQLINDGTINANVAGVYSNGDPQSLTVSPTTLINNGTIEATNGATLFIGGYGSVGLTNNGTLAAGAGSTLIFLADENTSSLGAISAAGGNVILADVLNNVGQTLNVTPQTGSITLEGEINGGTVQLNGTQQTLLFAYVNSYNDRFFNDVLNNVSFTGGDVSDLLSNSLQINGTLDMGGHAFTLGGIQYTDSATISNGQLQLSGATLQIGYDTLQTLQAYTLTVAAGGQITGSGAVQLYAGPQSVVNNGIINANVAGKTLMIYDADVNEDAPSKSSFVLTFTNHGTLAASSGATLEIGQLDPNATAWTDDGQLQPDNLSTIKIDEGLTIAGDGSAAIELGTAGAAGLLDVNGDLDLSALPDLSLSQASGTSFNGPYLIATYTGSLDGQFTLTTPGYELDYSHAGDIYVTSYTAVPEPGSMTLVSLGAIALLRRRRF